MRLITKGQKTSLLLVLITLLFPYNDIIGQKDANTFQEREVLQKHFYDFELINLDSDNILSQVNNQTGFINLSLSLGSFGLVDLELYDADLLAPNYHLRTASKGSIKEKLHQTAVPLKGAVKGNNNSNVRLTINKNFINGFIRQGKKVIYIEPVSTFAKTKPSNLFVVYDIKDIIPQTGYTCGFDQVKNKYHQLIKDPPRDNEKVGECLEVELAIASDWLMYLDYNQSTTQVEDHNIAVMNDVQGNYDDEFADELVFVIVEQFISDCDTCDPWTSSTNAGTLLASFRGWAPNGFEEIHDVGQLWTDRDFNGGTVGIAYVNVVCTGLRYHCIQDFTSNANLLRVTAAHELGHNFAATHDAPGSNTIMAPSVTNTNNWSSQSVNQINAHVASRTCLDNCPITELPVALFESSETDICVGESVHYFDTSSGEPDTWDWTFEGGTPPTSDEQNPVVVYDSPGQFDVTLTVTNPVGTDDTIAINHVTVTAYPIAAFSFESLTENIVQFYNESSNGASYHWQFGDGETSTLESPQHWYSNDGVYTVILTVTNECTTEVFIQQVEIITVPIANFVGNLQEGCAPFQVFFFDLSTSNIANWEWTFEGGNPATSGEMNPIVIFDSPGTYDVSLTVSNAAGESTKTVEDYITVLDDPIADFSYSIDGSTVDFTDLSTGAEEYQWSFGDNNISTESDPTHTYDEDGTYIVNLTVVNDCGEDSYSIELEISNLPFAGASSGQSNGCLPFAVQFFDESSSNVENWNWTFEGGTPANSNEQNPNITYTQSGVFDVQLIVSNEAGSDTLNLDDYVSVGEGPNSGFGSNVDEFEVNFTNSSSNANSYSWAFGDGGTSNQQSPLHNYAEDGLYTVMLIATNDCGNDTTIQVLNIVSMPNAGGSANQTDGCLPFVVQFSDASSDNVDNWSWSFPGGQPSSSNDQNPEVTYNAQGTYDVQLIVSNEIGSDTLDFDDYIIVGDLPVPGFSFTKDQLQFNFTNESTNANTYSWEFGDGNMSNEVNPSHTYDEDGVYTIILTASNNCGDEVYMFEVNASALPTSGFTANVTEGCLPFSVQFVDISSGNVDDWNWTFEGGVPATSNDPNPVVMYDTPGNYQVSLVVSNEAGTDELILDEYIEVKTTPTAGFDYNLNENVVSMNNQSNNATSYLWTYGPGATVSLTNPSISFPQDGDYEVLLEAINECGVDSFYQTITITAFPNAGVSSSMNIGCEPFEVEFFDNSTENATEWHWEFPGGIPEISTDPNPVITYTEPGKYSVSLMATNGVGSNSITLIDYVEVKPLPQASYDFTIDKADVIFQNNSQDFETVKWDFGDGETSDALDPVHTYTTSGDYEVLLITFNECGSDTFSQTISMDIRIPIIVFSQSTSEGCAPLMVQFIDQSDNDPFSWKWSFPGGIPESSVEKNPSVTYENAGSFDVTVEVTNEFGVASTTIEGAVIVNPDPIAGFDFAIDQGDVQFNNTSEFTTIFQWEFGDGSVSEQENPIHTYDESGDYEVILIVENNCGFDTLVQSVNVTVSSIVDHDLFELLKIYPNPNVGQFRIEIEGNASEFININLVDVLGRNIFVNEYPFSSGKLNLDVTLDELYSGTYFIQIIQENRTTVHKLLVQK